MTGLIAESLLNEAVNFGRLGNNFSIKKDVLERYVTRIGITSALLKLLEQESDLRFGDCRLPYHWNLVDWDPDVTAAGYTGTSDSPPRPSAVLQTLLLCWKATTTGTDNFPYARPLKAALYRCMRHGFNDSITYVIDLHRDGFLPPGRGLVWNLEVLARGRAVVATDFELAERLLPDIRDIRTTRMWAEATPDATWLDELDLPETICSGTDSLALIERAMSEIELLRASQSFDEWVLGHANVCNVLRATLFLCNKSQSAKDLRIRASLSQLEENMADSGGFLKQMSMLARDGRLDGYNIMRAYEKVLSIFSRGVRGRIEQQRVVRPRGLPSAMSVDREAWPLEWRQLSWRLVAPLQAYFPSMGHFEFATIQSGLHSGRGEIERRLGLLRKAEEASKPEDAIAICLESLSFFPWSHFFRWEYAIALDRANRSQEAVDPIVEALVIHPLNPQIWRSLGVILARIGETADARIARIMAEYVEETK